jgi:hypothetical protein
VHHANEPSPRLLKSEPAPYTEIITRHAAQITGTSRKNTGVTTRLCAVANNLHQASPELRSSAEGRVIRPTDRTSFGQAWPSFSTGFSPLFCSNGEAPFMKVLFVDGMRDKRDFFRFAFELKTSMCVWLATVEKPLIWCGMNLSTLSSWTLKCRK